MVLALAHPGLGVTVGLVASAAGRVALARLAPPPAEVVVVGFTAVTLVPGHAGLALTLPFQFALQASRAYGTTEQCFQVGILLDQGTRIVKS